MALRPLEQRDTNGMLEWMLDAEINQFFQFNPKHINEDSVREFIQNSYDDTKNRHYAIVDSYDQYLGTISLKNINQKDKNAEYAIALRKKSIGTGVAAIATKEILNIAFHALGLHKVYLNVLADNIRANKFYEKMGFIPEGEFRDHLFIRDRYRNLKWYSLTAEDVQNQ